MTVRHWTDRELAEELKKLTVICDTREQRGEHVIAHLDAHKVPHIVRKIDTGDYSAQIGDETFERRVAVERKHGLDELCGNLTSDRDRFEREFIRAKAYGTKIYLVIEDASWDDIYLHNYRSKIPPKSLLGSLLSWQTRFNVTIIFCKRENAPQLIYGLLYYSIREFLLYG